MIRRSIVVASVVGALIGCGFVTYGLVAGDEAMEGMLLIGAVVGAPIALLWMAVSGWAQSPVNAWFVLPVSLALSGALWGWAIGLAARQRARRSAQ